MAFTAAPLSQRSLTLEAQPAMTVEKKNRALQSFHLIYHRKTSTDTVDVENSTIKAIRKPPLNKLLNFIFYNVSNINIHMHACVGFDYGKQSKREKSRVYSSTHIQSRVST